METLVNGALDSVRLRPLTDLTIGRSEIGIGLIDGPVARSHPDLVSQNIKEIPEGQLGTCVHTHSAACVHGTFVAGILCARRGSQAPAICPGCTLLVRPIYLEGAELGDEIPSTSVDELSDAIVDCIDAGARVLNLSLTFNRHTLSSSQDLDRSLDYALSRGVIVVAAAGNGGVIGSSAITRHPAVIPVTASDSSGRPLPGSNLSATIGKRGLMAPGKGITSLGTSGELQTFDGTSAAAPFVSGTIALLWSEFPRLNSTQIRLAILQGTSGQRRSIVPPFLNAWAAYEAVKSIT